LCGLVNVDRNELKDCKNCVRTRKHSGERYFVNPHCPRFTLYIGKNSAIKIMDDLIDDRPLTGSGSGEMTFELIDNYLLM